MNIRQGKQKQLPLLCWDIVSVGLVKTTNKNAIKNDFYELTQLKDKFNWNIDLNSMLDVPYDAIVVTNKNQIIEWTNEGFEVMTGYSRGFVKGHQPKFLQGDKTSRETTRKIGDNLFKSDLISARVLNYRKNKEEYWCELKIYPLVNSEKEITHFIALEKEIH